MIKKNELLLIAGVLLAASLFFVWNRLEDAGFAAGGACVRVTVNGGERLVLSGGTPGLHEVAGRAGKRNVVEILPGGVRMAEANCPDQWCVRKGVVPPGADSIVCLPHRLIVRWVAEGSPAEFDDVDVVAQ